MDQFDLCLYFGSYQQAYNRISARTSIISILSDTLFPSSQQQDLLAHMQAADCECKLYQASTPKGHDAFYSDPEIANIIQSCI